LIAFIIFMENITLLSKTN